MGFFERLKHGLEKTREGIGSQLGDLFSGFTRIDEAFYEELEESLILADLGATTALETVERLREKVREQHLRESEQVREALREILIEMLNVGENTLKIRTVPSIILVVGVNGVGKTTTIGKLALKLKNQGKRVLLCAGDTFRAAAADQLEIWSNRAGVEIVRQHEGADPAAVVFDALNAARARGIDVVLCDTAGRLQNKKNLMNELSKISRIIDREMPDADRENLLVMDATTGQNGLQQAAQFQEAAGITGVVLTKLDGTAKGGVVIAVANTMKIPVKLIGVGEQVDDLMEFDPQAFVRAII